MKILSIQPVEPREVYAITTSSGTFIADGLAHHNCYSCNVMNHGEQLKYYRFMVRVYGEAEVKRLEKLKAKTRSFTIPELIKMREDFELQISQL